MPWQRRAEHGRQEGVTFVDNCRRQLPRDLDRAAELAHLPRGVNLNAVRILYKDVERGEPVPSFYPWADRNARRLVEAIALVGKGGAPSRRKGGCALFWS